MWMPTGQWFWHSDLIPRSTELWNCYWTHTHVLPPLSGGSAAAAENSLLCDSQYYQLLGIRGESQFDHFTWFSEMGRGLAVSLLAAVVFSYIQCLQFFSQTLHDFCRLPQKWNSIQVENVVVGFGGTPFNPLFGFSSSAAEGSVQVSLYVHHAPLLPCCVCWAQPAAALGLPVWPWLAAWGSGTAMGMGNSPCACPAWAIQLCLCSQGSWGCCGLWYFSPVPWWRVLIYLIRILDDVLTVFLTWVARFLSPTKK